MARRHASRACWPSNSKSNKQGAKRERIISLHAATFQGSQACRSGGAPPIPPRARSQHIVTQKAFGNWGRSTLLPVNNHVPVRTCFQRALLHIPRRYLTTKSPPAMAASTATCRKALRATGCELSFWHHTYVHALQVSEPASLGLHAAHACIREWNEAAGSTTPQSHALSYEWNQIWFLWNWIRIAFLSYFYSSANTNSGVLGYEHKKDTSDSIRIRIFTRFRRYCLSIFFVGRFRTTKSSYK